MRHIKYFLYMLGLCSSFAFGQSENNSCFKIGEQWHDVELPNGTKNVKWLFADDEYHTPFMSVSFDIDDQAFSVWAQNCKLALKKIEPHQYWSKDIELGTGGVVNVVRYNTGRYCISVERTSVSDVKMKVNGSPYFGCPINKSINY